MWLGGLAVRDLRNLEELELELHPRFNVFFGENAQGKTSLLEAVGLLARGRSFRTEQTHTAIRRGAQRLRTAGTAEASSRRCALEVEVQAGDRRLRVDGREVPPRSYQGRLEVAVYSTDRLRVVYGPMRERRLFLDRQAGVLWPAYRQAARDYERVVQQRNAALAERRRDLEAWTDRFLDTGAALRQRRGRYVARLAALLREERSLSGEGYDVRLAPPPAAGEAGEKEALRAELQRRERDERRLGRCLVGPHRDEVALLVDGQEAALAASAGQARSLLLALTLAGLALYRAETGEAAVALLDDLDSELDERRTLAVCERVAAEGQVLVTTAHAAWTQGVAGLGRSYEVKAGRVAAA